MGRKGKEEKQSDTSTLFPRCHAAVVHILWSAVPFHRQVKSLELRAITKAFVFILSMSGNCYSLKKVIKKANKHRDERKR